MRATPLSSRASQRRGDNGAVLVVVLLVMMALLGMGLTGLYLTTGSIQMNTNINMRNQALQVAEAGIQRAKEVLNRRGPPGWNPNISGLLSGTRSPAGQLLSNLSVPDAIPGPGGQNDCLGGNNFQKGAILRDEPSSVIGCSSPSAYFNCALTAMTNPNSTEPRSLGNYTVYIRQDQAECRLGSFACDLPDPACPKNNGIVVIRSEGTASDNRTMVAIEVTMAPNPNPSNASVRMATVCPAGQAGCDDNASVQQGITVSGALTPPPPAPPPGGSTGSSGASGAAGASGTAGATGGNGTPPAGGTASGGVAGSDVGGGGSSGGSSSSSSSCPGGQVMCGNACCDGSCGNGVCCPATNYCNNIALIGEYGAWGTSGDFKAWLATHSSTCNNVDNLSLDDSDANSPNNWTKKLNNYGVLIVLDLFHTHAEAIQSPWGMDALSYRGHGTQRPFGNDEVAALTTWVRNGGGLVTTAGVSDSLDELTNPNKLLAPFKLAYTSYPGFIPWPGTNVRFIYGYPVKCWMKKGDPNWLWQFVTGAPLNMSNVANLQADAGWPLKALGPGPVAFAEVLPSLSRHSWGDIGMVVDNKIGSPSGQGRVVSWADEWLTYNHDWVPDMVNHPECPAMVDTSTPYWKNNLNSCTQRFWNNIIAWVKGGCH